MRTTLAFLAGVAVTVVVTVGGAFAWHEYAGHRPGAAATVSSAPLSADLRFTGLDGRTHTLGEWRGKLLLINFWATWCGPCREEIPFLTQAQQRYGAHGLQVIGPAVDDPAAVTREKATLGIGYPIMVGTPESMMNLMETLGNERGGIPFSVLVAPDGRVLLRQLGEFKPAELEALIKHNLPG
ncbi:MAG: TlpA family protein disulfide reductase [Nevskiaceae bacterium]|nr:MAG: TlpA family protein disulfide reductase [Nevskiaceae bacterium]TBR73027.1 MAG: TlpA family protein disulfide reductase [Nevskiaceae bacterium]